MAAEARRAVIKSGDMADSMQQDAIDSALAAAMEKGLVEDKDIARSVKQEFDKKHGPTWHCVVGRHFGSYVTHEAKHFTYFYIGEDRTDYVLT